MDDTIYVAPENIEIIDTSEYNHNISEHFWNVPEVAAPLMQGAKEAFHKIEEALYSAPAFIDLVKAHVPKRALQAVLTDEQQKKLASGALELMTKKDGSLLATLINPKTKKVISTVPLKGVELSPNLTQAMINFSAQMQMAQIAEQIQQVQLCIEEVRQGQEFDRLAAAYSCQQKLLQAMQIKNPKLKEMALLQVASDAEDSRNLLMQSQAANLTLLKEQPESSLGKLMSGAPPQKIKQRIAQARDSLQAVNMVSLAEAMAYQELGETAAAAQSLQYYAGYLQKAYLETEGFVQRLDMLDPAPENYWSKALPEITSKINALPGVKKTLSLKGEDRNEEK